MAVQTSFGDENILRPFNVLDFVLPPSGEYETPFLDVRKFISFSYNLFNDGMNLFVEVIHSLDGTDNISKTITEGIAYTGSGNVLHSDVFKVKTRYIKFKLIGASLQNISFQALFHETPLPTALTLDNVGGGAEIYVTGTDGDLRTLTVGEGLTITQSATEIDISLIPTPDLGNDPLFIITTSVELLEALDNLSESIWFGTATIRLTTLVSPIYSIGTSPRLCFSPGINGCGEKIRIIGDENVVVETIANPTQTNTWAPFGVSFLSTSDTIYITLDNPLFDTSIQKGDVLKGPNGERSAIIYDSRVGEIDVISAPDNNYLLAGTKVIRPVINILWTGVFEIIGNGVNVEFQNIIIGNGTTATSINTSESIPLTFEACKLNFPSGGVMVNCNKLTTQGVFITTQLPISTNTKISNANNVIINNSLSEGFISEDPGGSNHVTFQINEFILDNAQGGNTSAEINGVDILYNRLSMRGLFKVFASTMRSTTFLIVDGNGFSLPFDLDASEIKSSGTVYLANGGSQGIILQALRSTILLNRCDFDMKFVQSSNLVNMIQSVLHIASTTFFDLSVNPPLVLINTKSIASLPNSTFGGVASMSIDFVAAIPIAQRPSNLSPQLSELALF
jgi:hypothetical protein